LHESLVIDVWLLKALNVRQAQAKTEDSMNRTDNDSHGAGLRAAVVLVISSFIAPSLKAQVLPPKPTGTSTQLQQFVVASVMPAAPGAPGGGAYLLMPGGTFVGRNLPVKRLVMEAYGMSDFQITGGPAWIGSEHYDIDAKADGLATADQLRHLMEVLLADRFKLTIHRSTKQLPIFVLVVGKSGPKIHLSEHPDPGNRRIVSRARINGDFTIAEFVKRLGPLLGRSVIDRTELRGEYDLNLEWAPDSGQGLPVPGVSVPPPTDSNGPSIFTAIQEQLGLRLESQKGPVEILLIDRVEKPSEN
jgi:uncharacterized protein (TIGR03435 family)